MIIQIPSIFKHQAQQEYLLPNLKKIKLKHEFCQNMVSLLTKRMKGQEYSDNDNMDSASKHINNVQNTNTQLLSQDVYQLASQKLKYGSTTYYQSVQYPMICLPEKYYDNSQSYRIIRSDGTLIHPYQKFKTTNVSKYIFYFSDYQIYPAFNSTYIEYGKNLQLHQIILHVSSKGHIFKRISYKGHARVSDISMLTDTIFTFLAYSESLNMYHIIQQNLQNHTSIRYPWTNKVSLQIVTQMFVFSETKKICLVESSMANEDNTTYLKITYFNSPLTSEADTPYHMIQTRVTGMGRYYQVCKLNNRGSLVWKNNFADKNESIIFIYSLQFKQKQLTRLIFAHKYFNNKLEQYKAYICDIWQPLDGKMYIKCRTEVNQQFYYQQIYNFDFQYKHQIWRATFQQKDYHLFWDYGRNQCLLMLLPKQSQQQRFVVQFSNGFRDIYRVKLDTCQIRRQNMLSWKVSEYPLSIYFHELPTYILNPYTFHLISHITTTPTPSYKTTNIIKTCYPEYKTNCYYEYTQDKQNYVINCITIKSLLFQSQIYWLLIVIMICCIGLLGCWEGMREWQREWKDVIDAVDEDEDGGYDSICVFWIILFCGVCLQEIIQIWIFDNYQVFYNRHKVYMHSSDNKMIDGVPPITYSLYQKICTNPPKSPQQFQHLLTESRTYFKASKQKTIQVLMAKYQIQSVCKQIKDSKYNKQQTYAKFIGQIIQPLIPYTNKIDQQQVKELLIIFVRNIWY